MGQINWKRVFLAGLMLGYIELNLQVFNSMLFAADELAGLSVGGSQIVVALVAYFLGGVATLWLYAAIRPRYGPGPRTAAIAGFVMWLVLYSTSAQWYAHVPGFSTRAIVLTGLVALPIYVGTTIFCASAYKEAEESSAPASPEAEVTEPTEG